jgi:predicted DNA binding CopG/RHH family protein
MTLNQLMKMPNFYETKNYRNKIKTPLECILGTIRKLEIPIENYRISNNLHYMMRNMGLDLYKPPGPNGWIKDTNEWLNYNTTIQRANAAGYLSGTALNGSGKDSHFMNLLEKYDVELQPEKIVNFYLELLTNTEINIKIKKVLIEHLKNKKTQNGFDYSRINGLIYLILTMPEYQLI